MQQIQLDVVGQVFGEDGEQLPGWHVNATAPVLGWAAWRVTPATPRRVFAGVETVFYAWASEAEYLAALDGASLLLADPAQPTRRWITRLALRNRFTLAEKVAVEIAQLDNPAAPMSERAQAAALRASQADLQAGQYIDLDRSDTRAGVQALEQFGLLAAGRAAQILDGEIQPNEVFHG